MEAQPIKIARVHLEQMQASAAAETPLEACGLLAGKDGQSQAVFPIQNELASPTRYRMAAKEQLQAFLAIERSGLDLLAIYHSHPSGPELPSKTDLAEALYPGVAHLIWSHKNGVWSCLAFSLDGGRIEPLEFQLLDE